MDRFKLDAAYEALLSGYEIHPSKDSCLRPVSEMCKYSDADWKTTERSKIGKVFFFKLKYIYIALYYCFLYTLLLLIINGKW